MEKIRLKLKAYDHRVLDRSVASIIEAVKRTGAELIGPIVRTVESFSINVATAIAAANNNIYKPAALVLKRAVEILETILKDFFIKMNINWVNFIV